jgi:FkbM family methyltransferase
MLKHARSFGARLLESHPYGYVLGAFLVRKCDFLLPHEADFWAFRHLAYAESGLFLDVGANLGHSARGFNKVKKGWTIFSIEANPLHKDSLEAIKSTLPNFDYIIAAADRSSATTVTLFVPRYKSCFLHSAAAVTRAEAEAGILSSFPSQAADVNYIEVPTKSIAIDDLSLHPDIIKMDIQGKEMDALLGCRRTIERSTPSFMIEMVTNAAEITAFLGSLGYGCYRYDYGNDVFIPHSGALPPGFRNVFFSVRPLC